VAWTTDDLVAAIRRQAFLPDTAELIDSAQTQFTDEELLSFADEELASTWVDLLRSRRDETLVRYVDTAVSGTSMRIALPARAMMRGVRRVHYVDTSDRECDEISQILAADAWRYNGDFGSGMQPFGWYFEADEIVLPTVPDDGSIRVYYETQFSRLVPLASCAKVLTVTGTVATCSNARPTWLALSESADVVRGTSPFQPLEIDQLVAAMPGSTDITLSPFASAADVLIPGATTTRRADYICAAETTCYPPLPQEWHAALASCVVVRVLEALGDDRALGKATQTRDERLARAIGGATPRASGRSARIINRSSSLRTSRKRWGR